jgi:hypothetical protein
MNNNDLYYLKNIIPELPRKCETIRDYLYLTNIYSTIQEKLYFKLKQIDTDDYTWLNESIIDKCIFRLKEIIEKDCKENVPLIENTIIYENDELHINIDTFLKPTFGDDVLFRFNAKTDLITDSTLWELKCTSTLSIDHKLQLVIYAWLLHMRSMKEDDTVRKIPRQFKLFNIKTNELLTLKSSVEDLHNVIILLLKGKCQETIKQTDEEFIEQCENIVSIK